MLNHLYELTNSSIGKPEILDHKHPFPYTCEQNFKNHIKKIVVSTYLNYFLKLQIKKNSSQTVTSVEIKRLKKLSNRRIIFDNFI